MHPIGHWRPLVASFVALLAIVGAITSLTGIRAAGAQALSGSSGTPPPPPSPVNKVPGGWHVVSSANNGGGTLYNELSGVSAISASDIWAVGSSGGVVSPASLAEHWNGTAWSIVPTPNAQNSNCSLTGVSAAASNDVWAVGSCSPATSSGVAPLIEHWDGSAWSIVATNAPSGNGGFGGVAAISSTDAWAVGWTGSQALIEQWDGTSWNPVASPNIASGGGLTGVAVVSATDIWAVGGQGNSALTEHWDGSNWSIVLSPSASAANLTGLLSTAAIASNDVWAVGYYYDTNSAEHPFTEHWNGTSWSVIGAPETGASLVQELGGVVGHASNDVWALGTYGNGTSQGFHILLEHWNGWAWVQLPTQDLGRYTNSLNAVTNVPGSNLVWAVGSYADTPNPPSQTLTEYYDPTSATWVGQHPRRASRVALLPR